MNERVNQIQARLAAINTELETATGDALTALVNESNTLLAELRGIQSDVQTRQQVRDAIAAGAGTPVPGTPNPGNQNAEQRAAAQFVQTGRMTVDAEQSRSVLVSSGTLATPTAVTGINDIPGAKASSIIDLIKVVNCVGMGSHKVAYVDEDADEAGAQVEGEAAGAGGAKYGFVTIMPQSVAVLDYISKQAKKQTPLLYSSKVREQALIALRRKAVAIVSAALSASELVTAIEGDAIGAKTLRTITMNYGGDESVVGGAHLVLNKKDLLKFGDVRGANEMQAVYEITPDASGTTGAIKDGGLSVRYCLNSKVAEGTLFYGNLQNLELDLFSDYEIAVSSDFAFDKLMDAIRGDVEMGSDVVAKAGFVKYTVNA